MSKELPVVKDISWVTPQTISEKRLDIGEVTESGGTERVTLIYKYDNGMKTSFALCPVRTPEAYFRMNGVEEDSYIVPKTGVKTKLGRNVIKLYMDTGNTFHEEFYETLTRIRSVVKKKLDKETGTKNNVNIKGLYDMKNKEKEITGHVLVVRLIESHRGQVYTAAYDEETQINVMELGRCQARPALIFSYVVPDEGDDEYRISVSVSQMYVETQSTFPLRDRD
jgi:hypothetical protein